MQDEAPWEDHARESYRAAIERQSLPQDSLLEPADSIKADPSNARRFPSGITRETTEEREKETPQFI